MDKTEFLKKYALALDEQQLTAMCTVSGPVLVLAVPGSGKTTVLLARLAYLIYCCGILPEQILTMTYTVAATAEMRQRFAAQFGEDVAEKLRFATINSVCARIVRIFEQTSGRSAFELVSEDGRITVILREIWQRVQQEYPTESDLRSVRIKISYIKNQMLNKAEIDELTLDGSNVRVGTVYTEYCRIMREKRWMDFDDQLVYALKILHQYPQILGRLQQQYRYFCVDEAQDTSKIQHRIIALLASQSKNIFMVGDEDQSIYGFRAACPEALLSFDRDWRDGAVLFLEQNYRSTPQIISKADGFIARNKQRREKHMRTDNPSGCGVIQHECISREEQYLWLAQTAAEANATKNETAVLYRDNDSALPVIDLLERKGIPYRARGVDGLFFTSRIVRDITDSLKVAKDPSDADSFLRIYYKFKAGISRVQAEAAAEQARKNGTSVFKALRKMELQHWAKAHIQELQLNFENLKTDPPQRSIARIVTDMNYGTYLEENGMRTGALDILRALAAQVKTNSELLRRLAELQSIVREGKNDAHSRFVLSTIHSSKGLEYKNVILADVIDGVLPQDPALGIMPTPEQLSGLEEDRRLFYVAMTRAKQQLTIVTFSAPGLRSTFSEQIFPAPKKEKHTRRRKPTAKERRGGNAISAGYISPAIYGGGVTLPAGFAIKARVTHTKFGPGKIVDCTAETVTIRFDDGVTKNFVLSAALRANAIKLEK